jgi:hypothetical protein
VICQNGLIVNEIIIYRFSTSIDGCKTCYASSLNARTDVTKSLKQIIKMQFPYFVYKWRQIANISLAGISPRHAFTAIVRANKWGDQESLSGPGSNLFQTKAIRKQLPHLLQELDIRAMLDIPCGDYFWMKLVEMDCRYIGADIVDELVRENQNRYGNEKREFINLDILQDSLPLVDMIFCRDCFVHFSYEHMFRAFRNLKRTRSTYLLTTTFIETERNENIPTGAWRPINLQRPPFNFPIPLRLISEECPIDDYRDKSLGLWRVDDIPDWK